MKSRLMSVCLCVVALAISMLMTVKLINSDGYKPPVDKPSEKNENKIPDVIAPPQIQEVELNANSISAFADRVEDFVDTLAFGKDKKYGDLDYIIENLDRVSNYLKSTEVGDKAGSDYLANLAKHFRTAKEGFADDSDFSVKVSSMLTEIDSAASKLGNERTDYYPKLDTDVNGSVTLAMLALYDNNALNTDGSAFTVTIGGNALLGDKLSTSESKRFSSRIEKYDFSYPFFGISSVISNDNMTFLALEAPLTNEAHSDSTNPVKGSPEYATMLYDVEGVSLASKSVLEYGNKGLNDTMNALKEQGISYSIQEDSQALDTAFGKVVCITFDLTKTPVTDEQNARNKEVIKMVVDAEREEGADFVAVFLHWNTRQRENDSQYAGYLGSMVSEYEPHFDAYNKEIARAAIGDGYSGADLVVGYGSRVAQGIERYNNKMIVYCPGDLTYSGNVDSEMKDTNYSFLFRQTFVKSDKGNESISYRIIPIVNTTEEDPYLPEIVFDDTADEIIENLVYQSSYFGEKSIKDFNYIKITK